jgi:threonine dehydrogenase-like Zn-dependent dehydrogenase
MTARIVDCRAIIVVDRVECRVQTARELRATHVPNTTPSVSTFVKDIKDLVGGQRVSLLSVRQG